MGYGQGQGYVLVFQCKTFSVSIALSNGVGTANIATKTEMSNCITAISVGSKL